LFGDAASSSSSRYSHHLFLVCVANKKKGTLLKKRLKATMDCFPGDMNAARDFDNNNFKRKSIYEKLDIKFGGEKNKQNTTTGGS
jgi:hypothetical protein